MATPSVVFDPFHPEFRQRCLDPALTARDHISRVAWQLDPHRPMAHPVLTRGKRLALEDASLTRVDLHSTCW